MLAGTAACASTVWTLEGRASLWMRHAEAPNMPVVQLPLSVAAAIGASADSAPHGAVMLWPLCHIRAGNELMRDALPGQRSLQRAAALLTLLSNPRRWAHRAEQQGLQAAVGQALEGQLPPGGALPAQPRQHDSPAWPDL